MNLEILLRWMREREAIRLRREQGRAPPWTDDPILQKYRYCNVRREDDKVTRWIARHIREPYADHSYLWYMLCIARQINWPPTLAELIEQAWPSDEGFVPSCMTSVLTKRRARGEKIYTGAYMLRCDSGVPKYRYTSEIVLGDIWDKRDAFFPKTLRGSVAWLTEHRGWGNFLAYQAVVDMRFTSILSGAPDIGSWAAAGPGTLRGLNRLADRPLKYTLSQEQALEEMRALYPRLRQDIELDFSDVPNVLCEVDKYLRVMNGEGRPRNLYHPSI